MDGPIGRLVVRAAALSILCVRVQTAAAQIPGFGYPAADSLLAAGMVARAESLYYAIASQRTRDPIARAALGRYLAARGAFRVGAVLLEEARQFGGDPSAIARALVPVYERTADHVALARLPSSPLSPAERARVAWLVAAGPPSRIVGVNVITYRAESRLPGSMGTVAIRIAGEQYTAILNPDENRVLVSDQSALVTHLRIFGEGASGERIAVADSLIVGGVTLANVPVTVAPLRGAEISLGVGFMARFTPTFDARAGALTLRGTGVARDTAALRYPVLFTDRGPRVLFHDRWLSIGATEITSLLANTRLTLDTRRGELVATR